MWTVGGMILTADHCSTGLETVSPFFSTINLTKPGLGIELGAAYVMPMTDRLSTASMFYNFRFYGHN